MTRLAGAALDVLTGWAAHLGASELAAFMAGEVLLAAGEQVRLAIHLAGACSACWTALDGAGSALRAFEDAGDFGIRRPFPPDYPSAGRTLPLLNALRRVRSPRSWPALTSEHLEAVRGVHETWGFARLLIEEADVLIDEGPCDLERVLDLAGIVVKTLSATEPACRLGADLRARLEIARAHGSIGVDSDGAEAALELADWYLRRGTESVALRVDLLLAHARRAFYQGSGRCSEYVSWGLELLGPTEALRRLEVTLAGVGYQELADFSRTGDTRYVRDALVKSLRCWRELRSDPDAVRRLAGLIRLAELALWVRNLAEIRLGRRPFGVPALTAVAGTLAAHLAEFEEHAAESIVEKLRHITGVLRSHSAADRRRPDDPPASPLPARLPEGRFFLRRRRASGVS